MEPHISLEYTMLWTRPSLRRTESYGCMSILTRWAHLTVDLLHMQHCISQSCQYLLDVTLSTLLLSTYPVLGTCLLSPYTEEHICFLTRVYSMHEDCEGWLILSGWATFSQTMAAEVISQSTYVWVVMRITFFQNKAYFQGGYMWSVN